MRARATRACLLLLGAVAACPAGAAAEPVSFAHGTVDNQFTAKRPGVPTGANFTARYHAAGDPNAPPPYMRSMTFHLPRGMHYDTSVPERCTASDLELALRGPDACPPGSRLGSGKVEGLFMNSSPSTLDMDGFNNEGEQVLVIRSPFVTTISRGRMSPDRTSITFESPTCYPATPAGCPVDNAKQLGSAMEMPPIRRSEGGAVRAYVTTPPKCPKSRQWRGVLDFLWADGSSDTVVLTYPCKRPRGKSRRGARAR